MKRLAVIFALFVLLVSSFVSGCISSPSPTSVPTVTPAPSAATSPVPTLIGGSDEAHVQFYYSLGTASDYGGLQKASPGNLLYIVKVNVSSDKPVETSQDWFWMEYKENETDTVHDSSRFMSYLKYPVRIISHDQEPARGELLIELPANMAPGYPKPYYYMPLDKQQGQYKVYDKVYGVVGDVQ